MSYYPPAYPPPAKSSRRARSIRFLRTHPTKRSGVNWAIWGLLLLLVVGAATDQSKATRTVADRAVGPSSAASSAATTSHAPASVSAAAASTSIATAVSTSIPPKSAPKPAPAQTGGVVVAAGAVLPNPARTPGAINPAVTQASIHSTICVSGWTSTVRPPSSYTTGLKESQLATGYAYHGDTSPADYEEDHLISLELGGSPTSERNLWPEPYHVTDGARMKDQVENRLHSMVCNGTMPLAKAQQAIASNWYIAYKLYVSAAPVPAPVVTSTHTYTPPPPAPAPVAAPPVGATGLCNDGTYSYALHHQGMCSHHGGVAVFYS